MTFDWYIVFLAACGIPVQAWLAWKFGKAFGGVIYGFICAVSVCRWAYAVGRVHGFSRPAWRWVPGFFLTEWMSSTSSRAGSITKYSRGGTWRGIGDGCVFAKAQGQAA